MSYIVQRNQSFYVVAYNGLDPITGAERRRWHPAGVHRSDAEKIQPRLNKQTPSEPSEGTLAGFMSTTWIATKSTLTHATRNRYRWMIDHNIAPRIGPLRLDAVRPADLDACYADLIANGGGQHEWDEVGGFGWRIDARDGRGVNGARVRAAPHQGERQRDRADSGHAAGDAGARDHHLR